MGNDKARAGGGTGDGRGYGGGGAVGGGGRVGWGEEGGGYCELFNRANLNHVNLNWSTGQI